MDYPTNETVLAALRALGAHEAEAWAGPIGAACRANAVNTPARLAAFLANVSHETAGFRKLTESLNYTVERLLVVFGRHRITAAEAARWGRKPGRPADQEALANRLYGGAFGSKNLGNTEPGDGWRFRGRGLLQTTGRRNYERFAEGTGIPLAELPALMETKEGAAMSAALWWRQNGCNGLADAGVVADVRRRVNGGSLGLAEVAHGNGAVLAALEARGGSALA